MQRELTDLPISAQKAKSYECQLELAESGLDEHRSPELQEVLAPA